MMRLPPFAHLAPRSLAEAVRMLADCGPRATVVAGGTDLYPNMKRRQVQPPVLVSLGAVDGLRGIGRAAGGEVTIGAMTALSELARTSDVPSALSLAASVISSPQIRNMGTVGGNLCLDTRCSYYDMPEDWRSAVGICLKAAGDTCWVAPSGRRCWAVSCADLAPVAIALGASVRLASVDGERVTPLADFYRNDGIDYLAKAPGEIVTELLIPPLGGLRATYRKVRQRASVDFPLVGVAVGMRLTPDGVCYAARIVLGAVASAPLRCQEAEDLLTGQRVTPELVQQAAKAAARPARPLDNTDLPHYYRKWVIPVHVARALRDLSGCSAA